MFETIKSLTDSSIGKLTEIITQSTDYLSQVQIPDVILDVSVETWKYSNYLPPIWQKLLLLNITLLTITVYFLTGRALFIIYMEIKEALNPGG